MTTVLKRMTVLASMHKVPGVRAQFVHKLYTNTGNFVHACQEGEEFQIFHLFSDFTRNCCMICQKRKIKLSMRMAIVLLM